MLTLNLPQRKDPLARLTLLACAALVVYAAFVSMTAPQQASAQSEPVILIATPTLPLMQPTEVPVLAQAVPTMVPELIPPVVVELPPEVIYVEPPAPVYIGAEPEIIIQEVAPVVIQNTPVVIVQTAAPEVHTEQPNGVVIIGQPTPAIGDPGFADSFAAPDPKAKCAFVGCL